LPSLLILIPLLCLMLFNLPWRRSGEKVAFWTAIVFLIAQMAGSAARLLAVRDPLPDFLGRYFSFQLAGDALTWIMLFTAALVAMTALLVGNVFFADAKQKFLFNNLLFVSLIGMNGTVLTADLFSMYVFFEVTSVSSFILIAFQKDPDALEGAFKYLILSAVATVLMLAAVGIFLLISGGTSFAEIRLACIESPHTALSRLAAVLFIGGLFIKAGVVPFHWWLPDAYGSAPAPVSVLLAGIVTKATGVYGLARLVISMLDMTPALRTLLLLGGTASIFAGALAAMGQGNFKRMLAYSSVSQVGYIVLALGCGTPLALAGAVFHLFNHAVFKSLLFVNAASVERRMGTTDMNRMGGLASRMPWTGWSSVVALLSTAGIPPLAGFWSKLIILIALWQAGLRAYAVLALLAGILTLAYFLSMQRRVFFGKETAESAGVHEADFGLVLPEIVLAALTVGVGLAFPFVLRHVILPIQQLLW
jgi:multicomponent Na+:H+ antiporter subunit D